MNEQWRQGKVLVCVLAAGRVEVRGWFCHYPDAILECSVEAARREGRPTWIERYGSPACLPELKRGFNNYRTGGID
jgi:hypothetical protein